MADATPAATGQRGWKIGSALLVAVLAAYALLGIWNRPLADDSCIIATVAEDGIIGYVQQTWWNWTGNVPSLLLQAVGTSTGWYAWWPGALLVIWAIGFWWLLHEAALTWSVSAPRWAIVCVALALAVAVNDMTDNRYQTVYWMAGTFAYALPAALTAWLGAVALRGVRRGVSRWHVWASILFAFLIGACSPTNAAFLLFIVLCSAVPALIWARGTTRRRLVILLGGTVLGALAAAAVILLSPGNAQRQDALAAYGIYRQPLVTGVATSFLYALIIIERTFRSAAPIAHVALIALGVGTALIYRPQSLRTRRLSRWVGRLAFPAMLAAGLVLTAASVFPATLSTGNLPEPRLWVIPQGIWAPVVYALSYLAGLSIRPPRPAATRSIVTVLVALTAVLGAAQIPDWTAQSASLRTYAADYDVRYNLVAAAAQAGLESVVVPAYSVSVYDFARLGNSFEDSCWQQRFPAVRLDFAASED